MDFSVFTVNLKMKNVPNKVVETIKIFFPENRACYEIMWKKYVRAREVTGENITQQCILIAG